MANDVTAASAIKEVQDLASSFTKEDWRRLQDDAFNLGISPMLPSEPMYKSPIEVFITDIQHQINKQLDNEIYQAVVKHGIVVDKEELLRALRYDRQQYESGVLAGRAEAMSELVRCKDCTMCHYEPSNDSYRCSSFNGMHRIVEPGEYCSYGERRTDG